MMTMRTAILIVFPWLVAFIGAWACKMSKSSDSETTQHYIVHNRKPVTLADGFNRIQKDMRDAQSVVADGEQGLKQLKQPYHSSSRSPLDAETEIEEAVKCTEPSAVKWSDTGNEGEAADKCPSMQQLQASIDGFTMVAMASRDFARALYYRIDADEVHSNLDTRDFFFKKGTDQQTAEAKIKTYVKETFNTVPLARVIVMPTVNYDEEGKPRCFSMTLKVTELEEIPELVYGVRHTQAQNSKVPDTEGFAMTGLHFRDKAPASEAENFYHLEFVGAVFEDPLSAYSLLTFAPIATSEDFDLDAFFDSDVQFSCADKECRLLKGKELKADEQCPLFEIVKD
jgi:hypothetical protein